jgi:hypothetical protein
MHICPTLCAAATTVCIARHAQVSLNTLTNLHYAECQSHTNRHATSAVLNTLKDKVLHVSHGHEHVTAACFSIARHHKARTAVQQARLTVARSMLGTSSGTLQLEAPPCLSSWCCIAACSALYKLCLYFNATAS